MNRGLGLGVCVPACTTWHVCISLCVFTSIKQSASQLPPTENCNQRNARCGCLCRFRAHRKEAGDTRPAPFPRHHPVLSILFTHGTFSPSGTVPPHCAEVTHLSLVSEHELPEPQAGRSCTGLWVQKPPAWPGELSGSLGLLVEL